MYRRRLRWFFLALTVALGIQALRLLQLQVLPIGPDYAAAAEDALYHARQRPPLRGDIEDRRGVVLATDRPRFDLTVAYRELWPDRQAWVAPVSRASGVPADELRRRARETVAAVERARSAVVRQHPALYSVTDMDSLKYRRIRDESVSHAMVEGVPEEVIAAVTVRREEFPGVDIEAASERFYPQGRLACHVLGQVGKVQEAEEGPRVRADGVAVRYDRGEIIGRAGLEAECNVYLRGTWGQRLEMDNIAERVREVVVDIAPTRGLTVELALDAATQRAAEDALAGQVGAAVMMDVHTGEVIALASSPGYDNNFYNEATALTNPNQPAPDPTRYREFFGVGLEQDRHPLLNRATQDPVRLGSVMKVVLSFAGLETGKITAATRFTCNGVYALGDAKFTCTGTHGSLDLLEALERSCNIYFYQLGEKLGPEVIASWAHALGLGARTGIDLPYEWPGRIPDPEWAWENLHEKWRPGQTLNLSIGEENVQVTPVQATVMMAAVANGGSILQPHLVRALHDQSGATVHAPDIGVTRVLRTVAFDPQHIASVVAGLRGVVFNPEGTAHMVAGLRELGAVGKTGTAEFKRGELYFAWFAGFAPVDNPQVAFAVVVHHSTQHGAEGAGTVASRMLQAYLRPVPVPGTPVAAAK